MVASIVFRSWKLTRAISSVTWAQRSSSTDADKNVIFLTIMTPDVSPSSLKLDLKATGLSFTGYSETKKTNYHVDLEFYEEIDVDKSKVNHSARGVEMVLRKKEAKDEFWPRLLKSTQKMHFLKTDFDKVSLPLSLFLSVSSRLVVRQVGAANT